jgi:hypothetical protein
VSLLNVVVFSTVYSSGPTADDMMLLSLHCNGNSVYIFLFWELRGLSPIFHIYVSVSDLFIPRIGPHTSSSRKDRPSSGNICFKFSAFCLCSVLLLPSLILTSFLLLLASRVGGPVVAYIPAVARIAAVVSGHDIAVILAVACGWSYCCCLRLCCCLHPNSGRYFCCCLRPFSS